MTATTTRARNGQGTREARERADGRYEHRYTALGGERKSVYGETPAEADAKLRAALHERDLGNPATDRRTTLARWLETWREAKLPTLASNQTRDRYRYVVDRWLADPIARRRIAELEPEHVQGAIARLERSGLAPSTLALHVTILRMALQRAVDAGRIGRNAARTAHAPKATPRPVEPPRGDDRARLLATIRGDRLEALWLLAILAGMRRGEIRALRWSDIDLDGNDGLIRVRRTLDQAGHTAGEPKSRHSRRELPIVGELVGSLRRHRGSIAQHPFAYVFADALGEPLSGRYVLACWYSVCKRAGVKRYRFHDLRHAFVVHAAEHGADLQYVSRYVGHASVAFTFDRYAQVTGVDALRRVAAAGAETLTPILTPTPSDTERRSTLRSRT